MSISIATLIPNRLSGPDTKTEVLSIHILGTSHSRPPHQNQVNSDHYTDIKLSSTTLTKKKKNVPTLKSSQVSSLTQKSTQFWPPTQKQVISMITLKPSDVWPAYWKPTQFSTTHTENKAFPARHKNLVDFNPCTKNKSISIPTQNQVISDPPHKSQRFFDSNTCVKSFRSPR